jgi:hypothetical protein
MKTDQQRSILRRQKTDQKSGSKAGDHPRRPREELEPGVASLAELHTARPAES